MADPNWNDGFYYDGSPPHAGLKLARRKPPPPSPFSLPHCLLTVPDARGMCASPSWFLPVLTRNRNDNLPLGAGVGHPFRSAAASLPRLGVG